MGRRSSGSRAESSRAVAPVRHGRLRSSHPVAAIAKVLAAAIAVVVVGSVAVGPLLSTTRSRPAGQAFILLTCPELPA